MGDRRDHGRGREATSPRQLPRRGWRDVALRLKSEVSADNVTLVAAGVAFYGLLALAPALTALVALYGLVASPGAVAGEVEQLGFIPASARDVVLDQLRHIASSSETALGFGLAGSLLLALWSASKGMKALITAMNIAYDESESRGFLRLNGLALGLTALVVVGGVTGLAVIAGVPVLIEALRLGGFVEGLLAIVAWVVLLVGIHALLAVLYRHGPSRDAARWRWVTPGSVFATALWALGSAGFSIYVSRFGSYNETYGALGAVVVLLLWFWISALAVLLGAELNAEAERQTRRDTTRGPEEPIGHRGAHAADTVGRVP